MKRWVAVLEEATSLSLDLVTPRPKRLLYLILLAWCGLVSGLLEVGGDHRAQATARFQSSILDEPSFRVDHPAHQSARSSSSLASCWRLWCCLGGLEAVGSSFALYAY